MSAAVEQVRVEAIESLGLLDAPPEGRFERIVRLACRTLRVPTALVTLVAEDRQFHVAEQGFGSRQIPISQSFCRYVVDDDRPMEVADARLDDRFRDNPLVTGEKSVRFYAGRPLHAPGGVPVGALCILDTAPRQLTEDQRDLLAELAGLVQEELGRSAEFDRGRDVQMQLLPKSTPDIPGYEIAGGAVPVGLMSGDFFDWYPVAETLQVVVADVMGKGAGAAIIGAGVRAVMRGTSQYNGLDEAVQRLAVSMDSDLAETGSFVTMFAARLDPVRHELTYVDAGHGLAGTVTATGEARLLDCDGVPIGTVTQGGWRAATHRLQAGETFICLSDGLLDLFDDLDAAVAAIRLTALESGHAQEVVDRAKSYAQGHDATDDVTIVAIRRVAA
ncbi:MAG TPA: SpoIIE family protein phosphatase [Propionibacteriaceae bacterium]|nr:SpoIIE family protein phosphatase [Propionibacteriaceae bacterium]